MRIASTLGIATHTLYVHICIQGSERSKFGDLNICHQSGYVMYKQYMMQKKNLHEQLLIPK